MTTAETVVIKEDVEPRRSTGEKIDGRTMKIGVTVEVIVEVIVEVKAEETAEAGERSKALGVEAGTTVVAVTDGKSTTNPM